MLFNNIKLYVPEAFHTENEALELLLTMAMKPEIVIMNENTIPEEVTAYTVTQSILCFVLVFTQ